MSSGKSTKPARKLPPKEPNEMTHGEKLKLIDDELNAFYNRIYRGGDGHHLPAAGGGDAPLLAAARLSGDPRAGRPWHSVLPRGPARLRRHPLQRHRPPLHDQDAARVELAAALLRELHDEQSLLQRLSSRHGGGLRGRLFIDRKENVNSNDGEIFSFYAGLRSFGNDRSAVGRALPSTGRQLSESRRAGHHYRRHELLGRHEHGLFLVRQHHPPVPGERATDGDGALRPHLESAHRLLGSRRLSAPRAHPGGGQVVRALAELRHTGGQGAAQVLSAPVLPLEHRVAGPLQLGPHVIGLQQSELQAGRAGFRPDSPGAVSGRHPAAPDPHQSLQQLLSRARSRLASGGIHESHVASRVRAHARTRQHSHTHGNRLGGRYDVRSHQ
ncbi:unnamed protein product [Trichogramma brassicae]|uniref:Uncharacterized protein n=1 Tax=Trichogramma brassicae TaxID=86971 RepID=A0A6H5IPP4_9HYME|nr:unnamed protein product [Trichogramma brassicae]